MGSAASLGSGVWVTPSLSSAPAPPARPSLAPRAAPVGHRRNARERPPDASRPWASGLGCQHLVGWVRGVRWAIVAVAPPVRADGPGSSPLPSGARRDHLAMPRAGDAAGCQDLLDLKPLPLARWHRVSASGSPRPASAPALAPASRR